jgi:nucleoside-diphosphate-sugar epimerase
MTQKTVGILGLGWLGNTLAQQLLTYGHQVKGTVRSLDKLKEIDERISIYQITIEEDKIYGDLAGFLEGLDTIYINIPPGLRKNPESNFAYRIKMLLAFVKNKNIKQVIFVSSTSVFKDDPDFTTYNEDAKPNATSINGSKIIAAEQEVQHTFPNAHIIRPCGLIGEHRHPIHMLSGRSGIKNPLAPINLVSREEVIRISIEIINEQQAATIIHAISEPHENRATYYKRMALEKNLAVPQFDYSANSVGKYITSKWKS